MKLGLKELLPKGLRKYIGEIYSSLRNFPTILLKLIDKYKGNDLSLKYKNYRVYYSQGTSLIDRVRFGKTYEPDVSTAILKQLQRIDKPIICDIGSNIGLMSLNILNFKENALIYAFEPGEHQRELFEKTIKFNKLENNIILSPIALSNNNGTAEFAIHTSEHALGDGFKDTKRAGGIKVVQVTTQRFDDWWKENNKPMIDFVKIDTEGAELMIFEGAKEFLTIVKPIILLELVAENLEPYDYNHLDILNYLEEKSYSLFTIAGTKINENNIENNMKIFEEFLALPERKEI